jgi:serine/threonine protein kinase/formylglycine-generating enzyme required for sulfatase activity
LANFSIKRREGGGAIVSQLQQLLVELEAGSTDLANCLSSLPDLSKAEQLQLVLADQKFRVRRGDPFSLEHYVGILPWLHGEPDFQRQLIASEFLLRLGTVPSLELVADFEGRYSQFGEPLTEMLQGHLAKWNQTPLDADRFDALCDQFEEVASEDSNVRIEDFLPLAPAASQEALLRELLLIESYHRRSRGESVDWAGYKDRFPAFHAMIEQLRGEPCKPASVGRRRFRAPGSATHKSDVGNLSGSYISKQQVGDLRNGRYRLERRLGKGAFGEVYLAQDLDLKRQVAVKIPSREALQQLVDVESYLVEAQNAASLDHPHIVTVYDVGRTLDGSVYVVSKFIDGYSLADWLKKQSLDFQTIARILERIAVALHHAHQRRLIHRDIKPSNILIEEASGTPYVADFGLAVREEDYLQEGRIAGTPAYMSPEQVRGEGHRLDGRSDLFSLGVVMYQMLTGRLPFPGQTREEYAYQITTQQPPLPRSLKGDIPAELERICCKLLSKRASDRYPSGQALADDLLAWLNPVTLQAVPKPIQQITPRGLRSFTADDADFFLDLLPGPRNREGLPESIAFWKAKIEQPDADQTFTVGLLYGPSGCGKSSLVKAGLIPHLSTAVIAIYVESTAEETESRLLRQLRKRVPESPQEVGLFEVCESIRLSDGPKVVLILDQFEQWLYSHRLEEEGELLRSLRQCDGGRLQAILMIRDDFYLAAARLMNQIDVPIVTDQNFKLLDLFDSENASRVLVRFGESYGRFPQGSGSLSTDQQAFMKEVVDGLSEDNKIVSVRLSLLADMLKGREWVPSTIRSIGGLDGIGISFLEETFASSRADARHRMHLEAVRGILKALLPDLGTDIKGSMRSEEELLEASGYGNRREDFQDLLRILDGELRLLTPTDPEGHDSQSSRDVRSGRYYQLTHDFLVPSLREWLTRKQRETKKGRAELKLAERAAAWSAKQESKQLPTLVEWLQIRRFTDSAKWRSNELAVMRAATRHHLRRVAMGGAMVTLLAIVGISFKRWNNARLSDREAENLAARIEIIDFAKLADELPKAAALRGIIEPKLQAAWDKAGPDSQERLKLSLGLLAFDSKQVDFLLNRLQTAEPPYAKILIDELRPHKEKILDALWDSVEGLDGNTWLPVASALADYDPNNTRWGGIAAKVTDALVRENALRVSTWIDLLRPASMHLNSELARIYGATADAGRSQTQIDLATEILETYAAKDFGTLHELIMTGKPEQFARLFNEYEAFKKEAIEQLRIEIARRFEPDGSANPQEIEQARLAIIERQANAAIALMRLEDPRPIYQFLAIDRDPEALSQFIYRIRGREVSPSLLIRTFRDLEQLVIPADAKLRQQHYLRLYGMILGLGEFTVEQVPTSERDGLIERLSRMYQSHPSRAVHSALGWLLRRWGQESAVRAVDETPIDYDPSLTREWYVVEVKPPADSHQPLNLTSSDDPNAIDPLAPIYFTMLAFPGGEYDMGELEEKKTVKVPGPLAVSDREVTWRQFSPFDGDSHRQSWETQPSFQERLRGRRLQPDEPAFGVNWFEALNYCRWLTELKMPGEGNQSYAKKELKLDQTVEKGWVNIDDPNEWEWQIDPSRPGFRLMREVEWEYVASGGMETPFSFGANNTLLGEYGWYDKNSGDWSHQTGLLRPSVGGLFDIHGNQWEWTNDWYEKGSSRVMRGGGWDIAAASCQTAFRDSIPPTLRITGIGFRLALVPSGQVGAGPAEPVSGEE